MPDRGLGRQRSSLVLAGLAGFCRRQARPVALTCLVLLLLSVLAAAYRMEFSLERTDLLEADDPLRASLADLSEEFPGSPDLVVVVEGDGPARRQEAVRQLAVRLEGEPGWFRDVLWGLELPVLREGALFYLDRERLQRLLLDLRALLPVVRALSESQDFAGLLARSRQDLLGRGLHNPEILAVLDSLLTDLLRALEGRAELPYRSPWRDRLPDFPQQTALGTLDPRTFVLYQTSQRGSRHLLLARSASPGWNETRASVMRLRQILTETRRNHPNLRLRLTGEPVLLLDERDTAASDAARSVLLSLLVVGVLVLLLFGEVRRPLLVMLAVALAAGWTAGLAALTVGDLNVISVWVATLVVVLAADQGIHILYRYEEERCSGLFSEQAMRVTLASAGLENLVGCLAAVAAFCPLLLADFRGLREMAILAMTGAALCFVATSAALPAFLFLLERARRPSRIRHHENLELIRAECWCLRAPGWVAALFAVGLALLVTSLDAVPVDCNLLTLQDPDLESVRAAHWLGNQETMFGTSMAPDLESLEARVARFEALPTVDRVASIAPLFPKQFAPKADLVRQVQALLAGVRTPGLRPVRGSQELERTAREFAALEQAVQRAEKQPGHKGDPRLRKLQRTIRDLERALQTPGPGPIEDALESFRRNLLRDAEESLGLLKAQRVVHPPLLRDLPSSLLSRTVGRSGRILLRIYPREDLDNPAALERFVRDLRSVDPAVTGAPVLLERFNRGLADAYLRASRVGALALGLLLMLYFRSLHRTARALLPTGVGLLGMLAALSYLGHPWNPVSLVALPLMLALGTVLGIHVVDRFVEHPGEGLFVISTGPAVAISALTTLCGFMVLAGARHQGIASLGQAMSAGLAQAALAGLLLLPALIKLLRRARYRA